MDTELKVKVRPPASSVCSSTSGVSKVVGILRPAQMGSPMSMRTEVAFPAASRSAMRAMRQPAPVISLSSSLPRA